MKNILELLILMKGKSINCFFPSLCGNSPSHLSEDRALFLGVLRQLLPCGPDSVIVIGPQFSRSPDVLLCFSTLAMKSWKKKKHYKKGNWPVVSSFEIWGETLASLVF